MPSTIGLILLSAGFSVQTLAGADLVLTQTFTDRGLYHELALDVVNAGPDVYTCMYGTRLTAQIYAGARQVFDSRTIIIPANTPFGPGSRQRVVLEVRDKDSGQKLAGGEYRFNLLVWAEANSCQETDTRNNALQFTQTVTGGGPPEPAVDIALEAVRFEPQPAWTNTDIKAIATVRNAGAARIDSGAVTLNFVSTGGRRSSSGGFAGSPVYPDLAPGQSVEITYLAPRKAFNAGDYETTVTASIGPNILESNLGNNSKVGRFIVQPGYQPGTAADLALVAIEVQPPVRVPGVPARPGRARVPPRLLASKLRAVVKNIGPDPLICRAAETLYLTVLASSRRVVEIKTDIIPANQPLAPGGQVEKTEELIDRTTGKPLAAGTYDLVASVGDPIGCENVNHGNNSDRRRITIPAAAPQSR